MNGYATAGGGAMMTMSYSRKMVFVSILGDSLQDAILARIDGTYREDTVNEQSGKGDQAGRPVRCPETVSTGKRDTLLGYLCLHKGEASATSLLEGRKMRVLTLIGTCRSVCLDRKYW